MRVHYTVRRYNVRWYTAPVASLLDPAQSPPLSTQVFQILLSLVDEDLHGYAIIQDVAARTDGEVRLTASTLYAAIKQIMETVLANKSAAFRECVLIEYPRRGIWTLGFITGKTRGEVQDLTAEEVINVFVPTTPNPTSGFLLFVPEKDASERRVDYLATLGTIAQLAASFVAIAIALKQ